MAAEYHLPQKWRDYLSRQPETAEGYHMCDIYFVLDTLVDVPIMGNEFFFHTKVDLDLDDIFDIVVKYGKK